MWGRDNVHFPPPPEYAPGIDKDLWSDISLFILDKGKRLHYPRTCHNYCTAWPLYSPWLLYRMTPLLAMIIVPHEPSTLHDYCTAWPLYSPWLLYCMTSLLSMISVLHDPFTLHDYCTAWTLYSPWLVYCMTPLLFMIIVLHYLSTLHDYCTAWSLYFSWLLYCMTHLHSTLHSWHATVEFYFEIASFFSAISPIKKTKILQNFEIFITVMSKTSNISANFVLSAVWHGIFCRELELVASAAGGGEGCPLSIPLRSNQRSQVH